MMLKESKNERRGNGIDGAVLKESELVKSKCAAKIRTGQPPITQALAK